jgi:hypothetical protein
VYANGANSTAFNNYISRWWLWWYKCSKVDKLVDQVVVLLFQVLQEQEIPLLLVPLKEILEEQD